MAQGRDFFDWRNGEGWHVPIRAVGIRGMIDRQARNLRRKVACGGRENQPKRNAEVNHFHFGTITQHTAKRQPRIESHLGRSRYAKWSCAAISFYGSRRSESGRKAATSRRSSTSYDAWSNTGACGPGRASVAALWNTDRPKVKNNAGVTS